MGSGGLCGKNLGPSLPQFHRVVSLGISSPFAVCCAEQLEDAAEQLKEMRFLSFPLSKKSKLARLLLPPLPLQQARFLAAAKPAHKFLALLLHAKPLTEEVEGSCSNHRCAVGCAAVMLSC